MDRVYGINSELVKINDALFIRDENAVQDAIENIRKWVAENKSEPSWGWNGLITKAQFEILGSTCKRCKARWKLLTKGLFGYECICSQCFKIDTADHCVIGQGPTIEDSVREWNQLMTKYEVVNPPPL